MAKNPSKWAGINGIGYVDIANSDNYLNPLGSESTLANIEDNHGNVIITNGGDSLQINTNVFNFKNPAAWESWLNGEVIEDYNTGQTPSKWAPSTGYGEIYASLNYAAAGYEGYPIIPGFNQITDNEDNNLTTNQGNFLVTTDVIEVPKYPTLWAESGA